MQRIEQLLARFGLTLESTENGFVVRDTLSRNKIILNTDNFQDVVSLLSDRLDEKI